VEKYYECISTAKDVAKYSAGFTQIITKRRGFSL
jgi:hypothetical protein